MKPDFINGWKYVWRKERDVVDIKFRLSSITVLSVQYDHSDGSASITIFNFKWHWFWGE